MNTYIKTEEVQFYYITFHFLFYFIFTQFSYIFPIFQSYRLFLLLQLIHLSKNRGNLSVNITCPKNEPPSGLVMMVQTS